MHYYAMNLAEFSIVRNTAGNLFKKQLQDKKEETEETDIKQHRILSKFRKQL